MRWPRRDARSSVVVADHRDDTVRRARRSDRRLLAMSPAHGVYENVLPAKSERMDKMAAALGISGETCGRRFGRYPLSNNASVELAEWFIEMDQASGEIADVSGRLYEQSFQLYELSGRRYEPSGSLVRQLVAWRRMLCHRDRPSVPKDEQLGETNKLLVQKNKRSVQHKNMLALLERRLVLLN
jgi:hypothetical protein